VLLRVCILLGGQGESTTDLVFSGHCLIAASDSILGEMSYAAGSAMLCADVDIEKLMNDRRKFNTFMAKVPPADYRTISFKMKAEKDVQPGFSVNPTPLFRREEREGRKMPGNFQAAVRGPCGAYA
jgi:NAD+ synthase (glutamine-hydrolysing)